MMEHRMSVTSCAIVLIVVVVVMADMAGAGLMVTAYSGTYMWYSGQGLNRSNKLSQEFPIPAGTTTLTFNTWYDIQTHWDYGYVEVSTDGGFTWTSVEGNITTNDNPNGNNPEGAGITGKSSGWVSASFDLSAYAETTVRLRFRYETDGSVNGPGWAIDDIVIGSIGFFDDVEYGPGDWSHMGWNVVHSFFKTKTKATKLGSAAAR